MQATLKYENEQLQAQLQLSQQETQQAQLREQQTQQKNERLVSLLRKKGIDPDQD